MKEIEMVIRGASGRLDIRILPSFTLGEPECTHFYYVRRALG